MERISAEPPHLLFETVRAHASFYPNYDVAPDGQRFVMIQRCEPGPASTQIHVVLNWLEELKRLAPPRKKLIAFAAHRVRHERPEHVLRFNRSFWCRRRFPEWILTWSTPICGQTSTTG